MSNKEKKIDIEDGNITANDEITDQCAANETQTACENDQDASNETVDQKAENGDPLAEAHATIKELKDKYIRSMAEFENYKKRTRKEVADLILNGGEKAVAAILPVIDDMERAIDNAGKAKDIKALEEGWELIFKKLVKTLEGLGVKKIDTVGKDFDVNYHEAVAMVSGMDDDQKGKVIDCVQAGYMLNDKVIRHAKVAVGQ
ncbi:nucleotide exchange factor GrpE [Hoylesella enoeca]|uniref:nucleotide exchange factor GrpE n=1 Tax=Hoylesella enoeca TaxID=76123 RepID=UPI00288B1842|nr:nucleotide exchange factor GrpE [Hoylesella enoeca]